MASRSSGSDDSNEEQEQSDNASTNRDDGSDDDKDEAFSLSGEGGEDGQPHSSSSKRAAMFAGSDKSPTPASSATAIPTTAKKQSSRGGSARLPDSLPVVLPASLLSRGPERHATMLVHLSGGEVDLEGDVGAIGRLTAGQDGVLLDLQGQRFAGAIVPTVTHMVLALGGGEAKVEAIASDAVLLQHLDSALDQMGGALVSGQAAEALMAFNDVELELGAAGAATEANGEGTRAEGANSSTAGKGHAKGKGSGVKKGKAGHEFFGTRRTNTGKARRTKKRR